MSDDRGARGILRRLLDRLDRWVERHESYQPVGAGGYIVRFNTARYRGPRLVLKDGTVVNPGDLIGELHMDNHVAAGLHRGGRSGFRFRRELFRMLPALGLDLRTRPEYREIVAVGGATLFWRIPALAAKMGFECRPLPPFTQWWLGTWERILLVAYHPEGQRRLAKGRRMELQHVWFSRRTLLQFADRAAQDQHAGEVSRPAGRAEGG